MCLTDQLKTFEGSLLETCFKTVIIFTNLFDVDKIMAHCTYKLACIVIKTNL